MVTEKECLCSWGLPDNQQKKERRLRKTQGPRQANAGGPLPARLCKAGPGRAGNVCYALRSPCWASLRKRSLSSTCSSRLVNLPMIPSSRKRRINRATLWSDAGPSWQPHRSGSCTNQADADCSVAGADHKGGTWMWCCVCAPDEKRRCWPFWRWSA